MITNPGIKRNQRSGLTLLELVVVLVILAALTGIAVKSLSPVADQARFEATQKTLENIRDVIQSRNLVNGAMDYSGFVSDMGRLPVAINTGVELQPVELWRADLTTFGAGSDLFPYQVRNDLIDPFIESSDPNRFVPVASGWRGPYLQLAPGTESVRDGYGRPIVLLANDVTPIPIPAVEGETIVNFGSHGAIANDVTDDLMLPAGSFLLNQITGTLSVTVLNSDGGQISLSGDERLFIRVYGPATQLGEPGLLANAELPAGTGLLEDHQAPPQPYRITCGVRTIRAVVVTNVTSVASPPIPPTEVVVAQSSARQFVVKPSANVLPIIYLDRP